jgi:hypothetical protein
MSVDEDDTVDTTELRNTIGAAATRGKKRKKKHRQESRDEAVEASDKAAAAAEEASSEIAATNHHHRHRHHSEYLRDDDPLSSVLPPPPPPPLRKGSSDTQRSRLQLHQRPEREHEDERARLKRPRYHSEERQASEKSPTQVKTEVSHRGGEDVDVNNEDDERGVSPPTQAENVPPIPTAATTPPSPLARRLHALSAVAASVHQPATAASMLMFARMSTSSPAATNVNAAAALHRLYPPKKAEPELQRVLPPDEPRKSGTCYFCKKAFMKNKQLMNHVCPKKPKQ